MNITNISPATLTSPPPLASAKAPQEIEALFVSHLLKQLRSGITEEGGLFPGDNTDTYGSMFDLYLGRYLAEQGMLGIGDAFADQLNINTEDTSE